MAPQSRRPSAPESKKKSRHSSAQKKAARIAREQAQRSARRAAQGKTDDNIPRSTVRKPSQATAHRASVGKDRPSSTFGGRGASGAGQSRPARGESRERRGRTEGGADDHRDARKERERAERDHSSRPSSRGDRDRAGRPDRTRSSSTSEHREHTFRSHRQDVQGRPDTEELRSAQRRPSGRDRAAAELTRPERSNPSAPRVQAAPVDSDNGFAGLGLHSELVAALARAGIVSPFPIQQATIPDALAGRDLLGRGQTGSGKTMAFGLPMLDRLATLSRAKPHRPHAVILTPTRELAMQIVDALSPLMSAVSVRHQLIAGGMSYTPQLRSLDDGVEVLVATPGRLSDLIERGAADLSEVRITVLDEADHMAEMGFVEAITEILDLTPAGGQRMLFSATLDHGVDKVAKKYLSDPVTHSTDDAQASVSTMEHHLFLVHPHEKKEITAAIANRQGRTVVFVRTKLGADRIATQLREAGVFAAALHGGLNQAQRTRVLEGFKSGQLPVLVATDVAARGIHVDDISLVLQADPPADHKDYLHRAGRTARAGRDGLVVTLALPHQRRQVLRLLDAAGAQTKAVPVSAGDDSVVATAGGRAPSGESIPQSQLDALLRPPRRGSPGGRRGSSGGRGRGHAGGRGSQRDAGRGGPEGGRKPRGASGHADRGRA